MDQGKENNSRDDRVHECPLEIELEQLIVKDMAESRQREIFEHLERCFTCNELYQTLSSFYQPRNRDQVEKDALPGMPAPLPVLFKDHIIQLTPDLLLETSTDYSKEAFLILSSLSSPDGKTKGSFFLSGRSREVFVVLRMGEEEPVQFAPIQVAGIEGKFLSDSNGVAIIGHHDPGLFMNASVKLFLPLVEITTSVGINRTEEESFDFGPIPGFPIESAEVYVDENFSLCLELNYDQREVPHPLTAVCVGKGKPRIVSISRGIAVFKKVSLGSPLHLFVYPL